MKNIAASPTKTVPQLLDIEASVPRETLPENEAATQTAPQRLELEAATQQLSTGRLTNLSAGRGRRSNHTKPPGTRSSHPRAAQKLSGRTWSEKKASSATAQWCFVWFPFTIRQSEPLGAGRWDLPDTGPRWNRATRLSAPGSCWRPTRGAAGRPCATAERAKVPHAAADARPGELLAGPARRRPS